MDDRALALQLHREGQLDAALPHYQRAIERRPDDVELLHYHAVLRMQRDEHTQAVDGFGRVLALAPGHADAATALTLCLRRLGRFRDGVEAGRAATRLAAGDPLPWMLLSSLHGSLGDAGASEQAARRALALAPDMAEAWHHLGAALQRQQRWREAAAAYARALPAAPGEHLNLGVCAERLGDLPAARRHLRAAHEARPERADALARLAHVEAQLCDADGEASAVDALARRLLDVRPLDADDGVEAFALSYLPLPAAARRRALQHYSAGVARTADAVRAPLPQRRPAGRRLRLGYISPDLGSHAVGGLMRDVFAAHDRDRVLVHAYSLHRHEDPTAAAIRAGCDMFHDCEMLDPLAVARRIAGDGIDVLVDLGGYTAGGRPEVLALRPAPRQYGYLGFLHAHAAPWLDAQVLDRTVLPEPSREAFGEPVAYLPGTMLPGLISEGPALADEDRDAARERFGLPRGVPLLASFNNSYKLDPTLLGAWVAITARLPAACFVVFLPGQAREGFLRTWHRLGGDPGRLHWVERLPADQHALRAACCDLFLDALRYQAGATGVAAVAAGLPVLGVAGDAPLQRLSASMNRFLGLDELVCVDLETYVDRAVALAGEPARLDALRRRMDGAVAARGFADPRRIAAGIEGIALGEAV